MANWRELESKLHMGVFRRAPIVVVRGEGSRVWDEDGKSYLDMVAGIAVNCLGHCHPVVVNALRNQAGVLMHTSNLYYTIPQMELAQLLMDNSALDRVFYANSGAEANEGAIKLARKYGKRRLNGAYEVISTLHSFHGRTLTTVAATGKAAYQKDFTPLPPGFPNVEYNDIEALKAATSEKTCAVLLEPIQGEGGVNVPDERYLADVRAWCTERKILLMLDEIQTGMGRTGTLWAYEQFGIEPDVMTLAKGLAGGVPIGAVLCKEEFSVFEPGDHGSTFGGNALACGVGTAVMRYMLETDLPGQVRQKGFYLMERLQQMKARHPVVRDVRGRGLITAIELGEDRAADVVSGCIERGVLVNNVSANTLRLVPPLTVTTAEIDEGLDAIEGLL